MAHRSSCICGGRVGVGVGGTAYRRLLLKDKFIKACVEGEGTAHQRVVWASGDGAARRFGFGFKQDDLCMRHCAHSLGWLVRQ